ncbi:glycosyltransferase family 2 protein [Photobacterium damselae]|uniref:glycosyltransferase family 2 protein n=1 Tax=Photobacterium damselae TaxID=38293 RepID=UPI0025439F62
MNINSKPLVSVIMPVFNAEKYIYEAVDSIINQSYTNIEIILINDGSTDESVNIIQGFLSKDSRIKFYSNDKNRGLIYTLNRALALSKGEYIARMDSDDVSKLDRLEKQINKFINNPNLVLVGMFASQINEYSRSIYKKMSPEITHDEIILASCFFCRFIHPSVMFKKSTIIENNLKYDEKMKHAEDYFLWSQITRYGKCENIPEVGIKYRVHSDSVSNKFTDSQMENSIYARDKFLQSNNIFLTNEELISFNNLCYGEGSINDLSVLNKIYKNDIVFEKYLFRLAAKNAKNGLDVYKVYSTLCRDKYFNRMFLYILCLIRKSV